jgi:transcriptional regulator with XRE-family HTH domain
MTQRELAGSRFSVSYISAIERGQVRPSLSVLEWCAEQLKASLSDLLGDDIQRDALAAERNWQKRAQDAFELLDAAVRLAGGDVEAARSRLRAMRERLGDAIPPPALWHMAYAAGLAGDRAEADEYVGRYRRIAEERKDVHRQAAARLLTGLLHANNGELARAIEVFRETLALGDGALVDPDFTLVAAIGLAEMLAERGDTQEAYEAHARAIAAYERFADPARRSEDASYCMEEAVAVGDFVRALEFAKWVWLSQREAHARRDAARLYLRRALLATESSVQERDLRKALALATAARDETLRMTAAGCLVIVLALAGQMDRAGEVAADLLPEEASVDRDREEGVVLDAVPVAQGIVQVAWGWMAYGRGDEALAAARARDAEVMLATEHSDRRPERAFAYVTVSELYELLGEAGSAYAALRRAVELGRRSPAV